jgi:uncharacterized membrane protein YqjE
MKLSKELLLTNLVLLGVLFWCAMRAELILWGLVLMLMIVVHGCMKRALKIERCAEGLEKARKMLEKARGQFKP